MGGNNEVVEQIGSAPAEFDLTLNSMSSGRLRGSMLLNRYAVKAGYKP